jgi:hypothetical protein
MRNKLFERCPYLRSTYFERRKLFERSIGPTSLDLPELPF